MTGCAMKSEAIGTDRIKTEGRQSIHRWRMSKIPPIVNGAEDNVGYADCEEVMVRPPNPVNLAAAVHDHISCTKSADLRKLPETKDGRMNLPLTDHMYANYSEKPKGLDVSPIPPEIKDHVRCLEEIVLGQLNLIEKQNETICHYEKQIVALGKKITELSESVVGRDDNTMPVVKKEDPEHNSSCVNVLEVGNNQADVSPQPFIAHSVDSKPCLKTKCYGRSGGNLPRSLKRRNWFLPKKANSSSSRPSISSPSHVKNESIEEKTVVETNTTSVAQIQPLPIEPAIMNFKKPHRKRGRKPRMATWKDDFLCTDKPYFLPDYYAATSPLANAETTIDVPSWRDHVYQSLYSMERTENLDDSVFQKRHVKYEIEEKRRKRRDLQQMREMNVIQKLQRKQYRVKDSRGNLRKKSISLYPSPDDITYIEVSDSLPVIAFGHLIPVFQPSEFSLPWSVADSMEAESPGKCKFVRTSIFGQKVT